MEQWLTEFVGVLEHTPAGFVIFILASLCVGSFLNTVISRLPSMVHRRERDSALYHLHISPPERFMPNLVLPPSSCPHCQARIKVRHLLPVVSYLILKGRCASCGYTISSRYLWVEIGTACLLLLTMLHFGLGLPFLFNGTFLCALLVLSIIDWEDQTLPDELTIPLLWLGILFVAFLPEHASIPISQSILGAVVGYLSLWAINAAFTRLRGHAGMGYGDFKLAAAIGAWMGLLDLLVVIVLAAMIGLLFGFVLLALGKYHRELGVPFGPFLSIGAVLVLFVTPLGQLF